MQNGRTSGSSRAGDKPRYIFFLDHEMPIERFGKRCGLGEASRYIFIRITMALRRPHKTIKMMVRRAVFFVWWSYSSPPLLDSSFRWNDEMRGESLARSGLSRIGVRDMLS